jgi:hypothetical protein
MRHDWLLDAVLVGLLLTVALVLWLCVEGGIWISTLVAGGSS